MLAQAAPNPTFWAKTPQSGELWLWIGIALFIGFGAMFGLMYAPKSVRKPVVWTVTFLAGSYWVIYYLWPRPVNRIGGQLPNNPVESVGFWLGDAQSAVSPIAQVLAALLLGLGVYSILMIHGKRLMKKQRDWAFSLVLLIAMVAMVTVGYANYYQESVNQPGVLEVFSNWGWAQYGNDLLFDGMLQQMDATMFSLIAFFILSAAYRAFRVRSIEATILLATALIFMLSLTAFVGLWGSWIDNLAGNDPNSFLTNFKLDQVAGWIRNNLQVPSIRALEFGIGLGALAMGLRIWLGLEKGGVTT